MDSRDVINAWSEIVLPSVLPDIARIAVDEPWQFEGGNQYEILDNYIRYTFDRQLKDKKLVYNRDRSLVCFNTGLVTKASYADICMVFERVNGMNSSTGKHWKYYAVWSSNSQEFRTTFHKTPHAPHYWDSTKELVYDVAYDKDVTQQCPSFSEEHIIMERIYRLPVSTILECGIGAGIPYTTMVNILQGANTRKDNPVWEKIRELLSENECFKRGIYNKIRNAIEEAIRRQRSNYKTIIPCYYPRAEQMCFLLPLILSRGQNQEPLSDNVALVLSPSGSDRSRSYHGHTIITMDMAYKDSRLICRPETEWLIFNTISNSADQADD